MARKGSPKVRTGCLTCKIRKVKCDEGKPHCKRCVTTGRKCDGYTTTTPSSSLSWHRPRHLFPGVDDAGEKRALQLFCQIAGPSLPGQMDPYFWTDIVIQFSSFAPAVRHSIVAIGSLYERVNSKPGSMQLLADNRFAFHHYNAAIRELKSMENEPLVLLVCVLFVCIEFLLGNRDAAIEHCKHGIFILENVENSCAWAKEYLSPIFRRLSVFPFFFGTSSTRFPKLLGLDNKIPVSFKSLDEAQYYVDGLVTRTVRLVRQGDIYRLGVLRQRPVSPELLSERDSTRTMLDDWRNSFSGLETGRSMLK
ncbi:hypothetical protein F4779DRAFT_498806 [Xylariaceae sp. FL0662B]|nr:hypothetical protein F4779DRAFT_498806 [Xylariaceae sp. FL0662B]